MKIEIGTLHLQLPAGFEGRAGRIARLVGEALAARGDLPAGQFEHLSAGPLTADPRSADAAVATRIADAIAAAALGGRTQ